MKRQTRRKFIASAAVLTAAGVTAATLPTFAMETKDKKQLTHHVFFWLKNPGSKEDLNKLIEGLKTLKKIETVRAIHIGVPASTEPRPVVETTYHVSELLFFDDVAGEETYQVHPIHKKFVEENSHLWEKVVVYDSLDVV